MTLFEKIYFTCLIITFVLMFFAIFFIDDYDGLKLIYPFAIQFFLTVLYLVVKLILLIWGIEIHWFPSLRIGVAE